MINPTNEKILEEFKKKFNYGVFYSGSSDLSAGEGIDWRYPKMIPDEVMDFILSALQTVRDEQGKLERNRLGKEIVEALDNKHSSSREGLNLSNLHKSMCADKGYEMGLKEAKEIVSSLTSSPSVKDDCADCWDKGEGCTKHGNKK